MRVIPAIDILDERVVRVRQGDEGTAKIYSNNPAEVARGFLECGATMAHVVDLNAALHQDRITNRNVIEGLLTQFKDTPLALEFAGGISSREIASSLFSKGARRIVLGSLVYRDLDLGRQILKDHGSERVVLALDYDSEGEVRTAGWKSSSGERVLFALTRFLSQGFNSFLVTSVAKDGMLSGPDLAMLSSLRNQETYGAAGGPHLIASGGISSLEDLEELENLGIEEAVVGKAIYEGTIDPKFVFSKYREG